MKTTILIAACVVAAGVVTAQSDPDTYSAASKTYFLLNSETGSGGGCTSTTYRLDASCGSGVVAARSVSTRYALAGGYYGSADTSASGRPWLAGVLPRFVKLRSGASVALHGTELNFGGTPSVRVDGQAASLVGTPTRGKVDVRLPALPRPGWRSVTLNTTRGTTTLPRGIGVLPMVYADPLPVRDEGFQIVFKGTTGDQVVWAVGIAPAAAPIPLLGFHHGLAIDPGFMLVLPGARILDVSGEWRLPLPGTAGPVTAYVQALFLSSDPAYSPGAFSNVLRLQQ